MPDRTSQLPSWIIKESLLPNLSPQIWPKTQLQSQTRSQTQSQTRSQTRSQTQSQSQTQSPKIADFFPFLINFFQPKGGRYTF
jgi:hypothetical protein